MRALRIGLTMATLALGVGAAQAAPSCAAAGFVTGASAAIDRAARSQSPAAFSAATARFTDLHGISLFALGRYRKQLPKSREAEYMALTRSFVGRFMADHASSIRATGLRITDCKPQAANLVVSAKINGGGKIIFKLVRTQSGYRIADLNLRSTWLAHQLRSHFTAVIRRGDGNIEALFKYLNA